MKAFLFIVTLAMASSAHASDLMETLTCENADQTLSVLISTVNRPDFDISKYDSSNDSADDGVTLQMSASDGSAVVGNIVTYASIDGVTSDLMSTGSNGQPCSYGTMTTGTQVAAKVSITGKPDQLEILTCSDELDGPHGGECN